MRSIAGFFLFLSLFCSNTELAQLFKLPVLIQHYREHRVHDPHLAFLAFLDLHYAHGDVQDQDYARDRELPFKKYTGDCFSFTHIFLVELQYKIVLPQATVQLTYPLRDNSLIRANFNDNIWQPPRQA